jgi:hypothetical protein
MPDVALSDIAPVGLSTDLTQETLLTFAQAARLFPPARLGRPVNISTIWRWCIKGVRVPGGGVIRLEHIRVGGRTLTSREAIGRFAARQTPVSEQTAVQLRTPGQRQRASEKAARELERIGI